MTNEISTTISTAELYQKIVRLIQSKKAAVSQAVNTGMVFLYWEIGETICHDVLDNAKAESCKSGIFSVHVRHREEPGSVMESGSFLR